jgi:hypothetical protein
MTIITTMTTGMTTITIITTITIGIIITIMIGIIIELTDFGKIKKNKLSLKAYFFIIYIVYCTLAFIEDFGKGT